MDSVKVPLERNPYLMFVAVEKESVSSFVKKGEVLKPMQFYLGVNGVQPNRGVVITVVVRVSSSGGDRGEASPPKLPSFPLNI